MANLIRSAKSSNDWTLNDLESYHISLNQTDALEFFGLQELPPPSVDSELLTNTDAGAMQQDRHAELVTYLDLAKRVPEKGETAVVDFVVALFKVLGYVRRERVARTRVDLPFLICGEDRLAKASVCVVDRSKNGTLLLVQEDKLELGGPVNARARLVAAAVAAFNENNVERDTAGLPAFEEQLVPGIVMAGTSPTFFKISVTQTLSTHIRHGTYPPEETRVTYCYPPVPRPGRLRSEGMKPLDNRREILKCFEALKMVVGI